MYTLIRSVLLRHVLLEQLPALMAAMIIAEVLYKFHSFTKSTAERKNTFHSAGISSSSGALTSHLGI